VEKGLLAVFEDYFFKNNPKSVVHYDSFIKLFIRLTKVPCDKKVKFMVYLLKHNNSNGVLTFSNVIEVSVFLCCFVMSPRNSYEDLSVVVSILINVISQQV
jgi:hypothetical protein